MSLPALGKSLQDLRPDIAMLWDNERNSFKPSEVGLGSSQVVWWKCSQGHQWQTKVSSRVYSKNPCPECVRPKRHVSDLESALVNEWDISKNSLPANLVPTGGRDKYWWVCGKGHQWEAAVYARINGRGCPYCSGRIPIPGMSDLLSTYPNIASLWHPEKNLPLTPSEITSKSRRKFWWQCEEGHEWEASMDRGSLSECPLCAEPRKSLTVSHPFLVQEWDWSLNIASPDSFTQGMNNRIYWKCTEGHGWQARISDRALYGTACPRCAVLKTGSKGERELQSFIESLGFIPEINQRSLIAPYELDLYLQDKSIAFEYNGLYWHSEASGKDKWYHFNKYERCSQKGVRLVQIWEDDWNLRQPIVKAMIRHILGISDLPSVHARKTKVLKVSTPKAHEFFEQNHILGKVVGCQYLGLMHGEDLVACMALRQRSDKTLYLERYATSATVRGGFTKILMHLKEYFEAEEVITFADLSLSEGSLYVSTGFVQDGFIEPDYAYLSQQRRIHKFNYRLKRFKEDPNLFFEEGKTETELAQLNKLRRIWDSGKIRYKYTL